MLNALWFRILFPPLWQSNVADMDGYLHCCNSDCDFPWRGDVHAQRRKSHSVLVSSWERIQSQRVSGRSQFTWKNLESTLCCSRKLQHSGIYIRSIPFERLMFAAELEKANVSLSTIKQTKMSCLRKGNSSLSLLFGKSFSDLSVRQRQMGILKTYLCK